MTQPQVQRPDPNAVKQKAAQKIDAVKTEAAEKIAAAQREFEAQQNALTEEEQKLVDEAKVLLEDGLQESDGKVAAQLYAVNEKHSEVERLAKALADAKAAEVAERKKLKQVAREVSKEKKSLKGEFKKAAGDIRQGQLEKAAQAHKSVAEVAAAENEKVKQVSTEAAAEVAEEKAADRDFKKWQRQDTWERRKEGVRTVIRGISELFNKGFNESEGVELPERLKQRAAANENNKDSLPPANDKPAAPQL